MPSIIDPVPTGSRAIAVRIGQPLRLVADANSDWYQKTDIGSFTLIGSNTATLVWTPSSIFRRFTFSRVQIGVVTPGGGAPAAGTLFLNLVEGPVVVLHATSQIRNEAMEEPPSHPDLLESDDPPLGLPLAMAGADRAGMGTVSLERAREPGGAVNLVALYGPGMFVSSSGSLGVRTSLGVLRGLGPFQASLASYHHGAFYFNYDFGKSRSLSLTRFLREDFGFDKDAAVVRGDGRRNTYRYFNFDGTSGVTYYTPGVPLQSTLRKHGTWFQETTPSGTYYLYSAGGTLPGRVDRVIDRYGNTVYYTYAGAKLQKVSGVPGSSGLSAYLRYDAAGLCSALVLEDGAAAANNRTTYFQYDANTNLIKITGPELCVTYFEYGSGTPTIEYLTAVTDSLNQRWVAGYDASSRVNKVVDAKGQPVYLDYDTSTPITRVRDRAAKATYFDYGPHGGPTFVTNVGSPSDYYRYDGDGNLTSTQTRLAKNWYFQYDGRGNRIAMNDPLAARSYFQYDSLDRLIAYEDPLNRRTYMAYDATRNRTFQIDPIQNTTYWSYTTAGHPYFKQDRRGAFTYVTFDAKANLTAVRDPLAYTTYYNYSSAGDRTQIFDPLSRNWYFVYDRVSRVVQTNDPQNATRYYAYNAGCSVVTEVDPDNASTYHEYDLNLNRTKTVIALGGGSYLSSYFRYDLEDRLAGQKDGRLNETYWLYDSLGRRSVQAAPLGNTTQWSYDNAHENTLALDPRGNATYLDFDVTGRVQNQKDAYLNRVYFEYDLKGNRVRTLDQNDRVTYFQYDKRDLLTHTKNAILVTTYMGYDQEQNRIYTEDPLLQKTYYFYDLAGRQTHARDALTNQTYLAYNGARQQTMRLDPLFFPTYFEYDLAGRQRRAKDAYLNQTYVHYDAAGNLLMQVDPSGFATYFAYDGANRRTGTKDAFLVSDSTEYDAASNVTKQIDKRGFTTYWTYDANNRRTTGADPALFGQTYFGYDLGSSQTVVIDPKGFGTYYSYDKLNRSENTLDAGQALTYVGFDAATNRVLQTVDQGWGRQPWGSSPYGGERRNTYFELDAINRVRKVTDPAVGAAAAGYRYYHYDSANNKIMDVDQVGRPTYFGFDWLNRTYYTRDGLGDFANVVYDARGSVTKRIDPEGRTAYFEFDNLARTWRQGNALGELTYFGFNERSDRVVVINARNFSTYYTFDRLRRVSNQKNHLLGIRYFGYDEAGNAIFQTDELFQRTYFMYDGLNRMTRSRDAADKDTYFGYDARSSLVLRQDADLRKTYFSYDGARRLSSQEFDTDPWVYHRYDAVGNMTIVRDETGLNLTAYDRLNRVVSKSTISGTNYYEYEPSGLKQRLKDPDLTASYYGYDAAGRLNLVSLLDGTARTAYYSYDKAGLVTRKTSPVTSPTAPTILSYYTYDVARRLSRIDQKPGSAPTTFVNYFAYSRDANGNIVKTVYEAGDYHYYNYDRLDRLTQDQRRNSANTVLYGFYYNFDGAQNRYFKYDEVANKTTYYTYNSLNLLTKEWIHGAADTTNYYAYDASQRMTAGPYPVSGAGTESHYYTYNQRNMATQIQDFVSGGSGEATRALVYNGLGERVVVTDGGTPHYWSYDGRKLILEKDNAGALVMRYRHNIAKNEIRTGSALEYTSGNVEFGIGYPSTDQRGSLVKLVYGTTDTNIRDTFGVKEAGANNFGSRLVYNPLVMAELSTTMQFEVMSRGRIYLPSINQLLVGRTLLRGNPEAPLLVAIGSPIACFSLDVEDDMRGGQQGDDRPPTVFEIADDDCTIKAVELRVRPGEYAHSGAGYSFKVEYLVEGAHVAKCERRQLINISYDRQHFDGSEYTKPQLVATLRDAKLAEGVNTERFVTDTDWDWGPFGTVRDEDHAFDLDTQTLPVKSETIRERKVQKLELAEIRFQYRYQIRRKSAIDKIIWTHYWGYAWTNEHLQVPGATHGEMKLPATVDEELTKGRFYGEHGISGVEKLNG